MHITKSPVLHTGNLFANTVILDGAHKGVTGMILHCTGVGIPKLAAVAIINCGLLGLMHIPKLPEVSDKISGGDITGKQVPRTVFGVAITGNGTAPN